MRFFIGSYTRLHGPGVGLCALENGALSLLASDPLPNATYVILNRARDRLFAISSDPVEASGGGSAASYAVEDGALRLLSRQDVTGSGPCHLCLSPDERFLYTTNYFSGSVSVLPVDGEGVIGPIRQLVQHEGHSAHPTRQTGPHAHQVTFLPDTNLLCAVDLGLDALLTYAQDPKAGLLTPHDRLDVPPGLGPRHLVHGESGAAWLAHEIGSAVSLLRRMPGGWRVEQTLSTLPEVYAGVNTASAIRRTPDGQRIAVSNRGHDSLAVYAIGADSRLTLERILPTGDALPRDFDFIDDTTLLIGHQDGALTLAGLRPDGIVPLDTLPLHGVVCVCIER